GKLELAGRRIQGGEQSVLGPDVGAGQHVEQCRLAGIRVADDRGSFQGGAPPPGPLLVPLGAYLFDFPVEITDPFPDAPALDLDLLLAESTPGPHSPSPPADLAVVRVRPDQARQQVMQPSRFDLEPAFVRARV